jgi:hypothetical protein
MSVGYSGLTCPPPWEDSGEHGLKDVTPEIVVTDDMVDAGLNELREHHHTDDLRYVLECVYRAMAYASLSASTTSDSK